MASLHSDAVKRKDGIIARLMANHDFAFDQHTAAALAHMEHLERLIRLQDQRLLLIERQFEADLKVCPCFVRRSTPCMGPLPSLLAAHGNKFVPVASGPGRRVRRGARGGERHAPRRGR